VEYFFLVMAPFLVIAIGVASAAVIEPKRKCHGVNAAFVRSKRKRQMTDKMLPDPERQPIAQRIEDQAARAARSVREELEWADADKALIRARELLKEWQWMQPHSHSR
jgi:hypothetical protein